MHHGKVTHRAVGHGTDATQAPVHVGVDLAPERADAALLVDVLHYRDGGLRGLCEIFVVSELVAAPLGRIVRRGTADSHRLGVADDRRQFRRCRDQRLPREAADGTPALRDFEGIGDRRCIVLLQFQEQVARVHWHSRQSIGKAGAARAPVREVYRRRGKPARAHVTARRGVTGRGLKLPNREIAGHPAAGRCKLRQRR